MSHEQVKARINKKTGEVFIEGCGFNGDKCDILKDVENQLGTITNTEEKDERYNFIQPDYLPNHVG